MNVHLRNSSRKMKQFLPFLFSFSCLFLFTESTSIAQSNLEDSTIAAPIFGVHYLTGIPGGDLKDRYGYINNVGFTAGYKLKNNLYFGLMGNFGFGKNNKLPDALLFGHLMDNYGQITDSNGEPAAVLTFARQYTLNIEIGYVFKRLGHNPNSGLWVKLGGGFTANKIRVESNDQLIPTLELDYRKGYDHLTTGFNSSQFLGYLFLSGRSALNFYAGFYAQQGYTYDRRNSFYYQPEIPVSTKMRLDITYGVKVGWIIPIYKKIARDFYYN